MKYFIKITKLCAKKTLFWLVLWSKNFIKSLLKHVHCVRFYNIKKSNSCVIFISNPFLLSNFNRFFCFHSLNIVLAMFLSFYWQRATTNSRPSSFGKPMSSVNSTTKHWNDIQPKFRKQMKHWWTLCQK